MGNFSPEFHLSQSYFDNDALELRGDYASAIAIKVHRRRGIQLPQKLSVVGYDDAPVAEQVWPGMTPVHEEKTPGVAGKESAIAIACQVLSTPSAE